MNNLMTFTNKEFGQLRSILFNGVIYFVGEDVAMSLGYSDANEPIQMYVDKEDRMSLNFEMHSQNMPCLWNENDFADKIVINESGIYSLVLRSNVPKAREYKNWIACEVLPDLHYKVYCAIPSINLSNIRGVFKSHGESKETFDNTFEGAVVKIYSKNDLKDFQLISEEEKSRGIGYFYLVEINNDVKIGCTQNPLQRYNSLEREIVKYGGGTIGKMAVSQPHGNYQENEKRLHEYFAKHRVEGTEIFVGKLKSFIDNLPKLRCYKRNQVDDEANRKLGCIHDSMFGTVWRSHE